MNPLEIRGRQKFLRKLFEQERCSLAIEASDPQNSAREGG
jgi:hypothetical protein